MSFFSNYEKELRSCKTKKSDLKRELEHKDWKIKSLEDQIRWHEENLKTWKRIWSSESSLRDLDLVNEYLKKRFNK